MLGLGIKKGTRLWQNDPAIRRRKRASRREARVAVKSEMHLRDFLKIQTDIYAGKKPQLPDVPVGDVTWKAVDRDIHVEMVPHNAYTHPSASGPERCLDTTDGGAVQGLIRDLCQRRNEIEGWEIRTKMQATDEEIDRLKAEQSAAETLLQEVEEGAQKAIMESKEIIRSHAPSRPNQPDRPSGPWLKILYWALLVLIIGVLSSFGESYQLAVPYMNMVGIDTNNLGIEWERNGIGILTAGVFCFGVVVSLLLMYWWIFQIASKLEQEGTFWGRALKVGWALALAFLITATARGIGSMRHGISEGSSMFLSSLTGSQAAQSGDGQVFVLLTLIVPLGVAYFLHAQLPPALEDIRQRLVARRAWMADWYTREEDKRQVRVVQEDRIQFEEERIRVAQEKKHQAEARLEAAWQKKQDLTQQAMAIEQTVRETIQQQMAIKLNYEQSLKVAVAQDKKEFIKRAKKLGANSLVFMPSLPSSNGKATSVPVHLSHQTNV